MILACSVAFTWVNIASATIALIATTVYIVRDRRRR
jgi:hypothetical protein